MRKKLKKAFAALLAVAMVIGLTQSYAGTPAYADEESGETVQVEAAENMTENDKEASPEEKAPSEEDNAKQREDTKSDTITEDAVKADEKADTASPEEKAHSPEPETVSPLKEPAEDVKASEPEAKNEYHGIFDPATFEYVDGAYRAPLDPDKYVAGVEEEYGSVMPRAYARYRAPSRGSVSIERNNVYSGGHTTHYTSDTGYNADWTSQATHSFAVSGYSTDGYCIQPGIEFYGGEYTSYDASGYLTQSQIDRAAIGLQYIYAHYSGATRYSLAQGWVWSSVVGSSIADEWFRRIGVTGNISFAGFVAGGSTEGYNAALSYYNVNSGNYTCTATVFIKSGSQAIAVFEARELPKTGSLILKKTVASNKALTDMCPENYTLAGAHYYVSTGSDGSGYVGELITGADGGTNTLELSAGRYYVKEVTAPKGYKLDTKYHSIDVTSGGTATVECSDEPLFDPLALVIRKKAAEGADENLPIEGAVYTVKYYRELTDDVTGLTPFRTWVFRTDKNGTIRTRDKWKVGGDELFHNEAGSPVGLYGTYTFEETKAPPGFAKTEGIISIQQVKEGAAADHVQVLKDVTDTERPQTVSIEVNKTDAVTGLNTASGAMYGGTLKGAVYEVSYYDPVQAQDIKVGEITTDEAGRGKLTGLKPGKYTVREVTAPAGYVLNPETVEIYARITEINTANFNYVADFKEPPITVNVKKTSFNEAGAYCTVGGATLQLKDMAGNVLDTWKTKEGEAHTMTGIPAGVYQIVETEAPNGYFPQKEPQLVTVKAVAGAQEVDVFNEAVPELKTKAAFNSGAKESEPLENVTVTDQVSYMRLIPGKEYTVKGTLVDKADPDTVIAHGETTFTAAKPNGVTEVRFTFDASKLEGKTMVVFEELYRERIKLASHAELQDEELTVRIPKVRTEAFDKKDAGKDLFAGKNETIVDTVKYENLTAGKEYTVKGTLMDQETGKTIVVNGSPVTAEKTFKPNASTGEVVLEFNFDASALQGKTVVVFEDVYNDGIKVGSHADIDDISQSIYVPGIKTTATSEAEGSKKIDPVGNVVITDVIHYDNLIPGTSYTVKGRLIDKSTGEAIALGGTLFTADKASGDVSLSFYINAKGMDGKSLVAFEEIYKGDKLIGEHSDINDEGQTVTARRMGRIELRYPNTGDASGIAIYLAVFACAFAGVLAVRARRGYGKNKD